MIYTCPEVTECRNCGHSWDDHWCDGAYEESDWEDVWGCAGGECPCGQPWFTKDLGESCGCPGAGKA